MQVSSDDQLLASAASFLIEGQEEDAASVLLSCSLSVGESDDTCSPIRFVDEEFGYDAECALYVKLTCPRVAYEILCDDNCSITRAIRHALEAVMPDDTYIRHLTVHAELIDIDSDCRTELRLHVGKAYIIKLLWLNQLGFGKICVFARKVRFESHKLSITWTFFSCPIAWLVSVLQQDGEIEKRTS
jgi:hypothetical protein